MVSPEISILSIGNANMDYLYYVDKHPPIDEQVEARAFVARPGGSACNLAVAVARLGARAGFLGCVGRDAEGEIVLEHLDKEGVDISRVKRAEKSPTGRVVVVVDREGRRTMIAYRGANLELSVNDVRAEKLEGYGHVHVSGHRVEIAREALSAAKSLGARTSYDPGTVNARERRSGVLELLEFVDVLFVNEVELWYLLGGEVRDLYSAFEELGVECLVVKMGERGSSALKRGLHARAKAFSTEVVDPTGAGDAFDGAFLVAYALGLELEEALLTANAAAAIKISREGAQSSPRMEELLAFLRAEGLYALGEKLSRATEWDRSGYTP